MFLGYTYHVYTHLYMYIHLRICPYEMSYRKCNVTICVQVIFRSVSFVFCIHFCTYIPKGDAYDVLLGVDSFLLIFSGQQKTPPSFPDGVSVLPARSRVLHLKFGFSVLAEFIRQDLHQCSFFRLSALLQAI